MCYVLFSFTDFELWKEKKHFMIWYCVQQGLSGTNTVNEMKTMYKEECLYDNMIFLKNNYGYCVDVFFCKGGWMQKQLRQLSTSSKNFVPMKNRTVA